MSCCLDLLDAPAPFGAGGGGDDDAGKHSLLTAATYSLQSIRPAFAPLTGGGGTRERSESICEFVIPRSSTSSSTISASRSSAGVRYPRPLPSIAPSAASRFSTSGRNTSPSSHLSPPPGGPCAGLAAAFEAWLCSSRCDVDAGREGGDERGRRESFGRCHSILIASLQTFERSLAAAPPEKRSPYVRAKSPAPHLKGAMQAKLRLADMIISMRVLRGQN